MAILVSVILSIVFLLLSGIHFYWGLGGKWGGEVAIPTTINNEKVMNPKFLECFIVGLGLLVFGLFVLIKSGIIVFNLPVWMFKYGLWIISAIFILRSVGEFKYVGFFKKIRNTKFGKMDTKFYSPFCLGIGAVGIILEMML